MSRTPRVFAPAEPESLSLSDVPNIKGKAAAVAWYRDVLGIEVTLNNVKAATESRELSSYMIGSAVHYSTRDLWVYLAKGRRSADMEVPA